MKLKVVLVFQQISIANDIGIPSSKSASLIGFQAITQTASRIVFGRLGSSPRIDRVTSVQIIGLVLAINATLFPLARTYSSLVVYVVVFGLFDGCLAVMFGMGTLYIVGEKLVGRAFGNLCFAAAIGNLLGPPVAGWYSVKTESIRKLSNFNFQWTKTLFQNISSHIAFLFVFFEGYRCYKLSVITPKKICYESSRKKMSNFTK